MLKSITPLAMLAIVFVPSSANADLRQQYNAGGCKKYYKIQNKSGFRCTDSMNNVYAVYTWSNTMDKKGSVGKKRFTNPPYPEIYQYYIESNNLVEYTCKEDPSTRTCAGKIKRAVYVPISRSQIRQTNQSTTPARKTKQSNDGVSPLSTIVLETPDAYVTRGDAKYDLNDKVGACFDYKKAISLSSAKPTWQKNLVIVKHDSRCRTAQDYKSKCSSDGKTCMYYPVKP